MKPIKVHDALSCKRNGLSEDIDPNMAVSVPFRVNKEANLTKVLEPSTLLSGTGKMTMHLLRPAFGQGPGKPIATLIQVGTISGSKWRVIEYKARKPIKLAANSTYWLCATVRPEIQVAWAKNVKGDSDAVYGTFDGSCNGTNWGYMDGREWYPAVYALF